MCRFCFVLYCCVLCVLCVSVDVSRQLLFDCVKYCTDIYFLLLWITSISWASIGRCYYSWWVLSGQHVGSASSRQTFDTSPYDDDVGVFYISV